MCFNCGSLDHLLKECKEPFDQDAINKRKAILSSAPSRGGGQGRGRGRGGRGRSGNRNGSKGPKDPKKAPPGKDEPREKTLHRCGRCGEWLPKDHTCKKAAATNGDDPEANIAYQVPGIDQFHGMSSFVGFKDSNSWKRSTLDCPPQ